jgi:acyl dehydratase
MTKTAIKLRELESRIGEEVGISPWVEILQERIDKFAEATGDFQWIHVDPKRARDSPFGGTIAHGFLTLSMLPKLSESTFEFSDRKMGVNYGLNKVRFTAPVPAGSRVRLHQVLKGVEDIKGGVRMTFESSVEIEGSDKPALVAEALVLAFD